MRASLHGVLGMGALAFVSACTLDFDDYLGDAGTGPATEGGPGVGDCVPASTAPETVALYHFEDGALSERGPEIVNTEVSLPGPGGCGQAVGFTGAGPTTQIIDDDVWDLATGSIELWVYFDTLSGPRPVLSRDAAGDGDGHFNLVASEVFEDGSDGSHLTLRIQHGASADVVCSFVPLQTERWYRVQMSFGDGRPATLSVGGDDSAAVMGRVMHFGDERCAQMNPGGLGTLDLPWTLGRGFGLEAMSPMEGRIDELHFRSVRLDR